MKKAFLVSILILLLILAKAPRSAYGQEMEYEGPHGLTVEGRTSEEEFDQKMGVDAGSHGSADDEGLPSQVVSTDNSKAGNSGGPTRSLVRQGPTVIGTIKTTTQFEKPAQIDLETVQQAPKKKISFSDMAKKKKPK